MYILPLKTNKQETLYVPNKTHVQVGFGLGYVLLETFRKLQYKI